ncbi:hypothetical protein V2G26_020424 [Clonostachys chloroleuca]
MSDTSSPKSGYIRLGTASPAPHPTDTQQTLRQLEQIAKRAAAQHIDILVLPEAYLGGYPRGEGFGAVVGSRSGEGRQAFLEYFKASVDLGDVVGVAGAGGQENWVKRELPELADAAAGAGATRGDGTREELERISQETNVFIVVGLVERAGGSLYCSVVYVEPSRGIIGKRRKVLPTGSERLIWSQGSAATLRAVSTTIRGVRINLAAAICWENYMPLVRQAIYAQNVNLYLAPTADARDAWLSLMRTVGNEGRCFVVSSNLAVPPSEGEEAWVCRGGSSIVNPQGEVLAGPQWEDSENLIWSDVDFEDCVRGRLDIDVAGSYSRNDAFQLSVQGLDLTPLPYY